jgi:hypothetical protein
VVAIDDAESDRAAERFAAAHSGDEVGLIRLDFHAPTAAVAALTPGEIAVHIFCKEG